MPKQPNTPNTNFNQDICAALRSVSQNKRIWFSAQRCSAGYWLPGSYQVINSAGQRVTVEPARITDQEVCESAIFAFMINICFMSDE